MAEEESVRLVLTPEQRELVSRLSGKHVEAIDLEHDKPNAVSGPIQLLWRLSAATGIPRQNWTTNDPPQAEDASKDPGS